jgi:uncharacterized protein
MNFKNILTSILAVVVTASSLCVSARAAEPKTIVVYGASGNIGGKIAREALNRGYRVVGVSRDPAKDTIKHNKFTAAKGDVTDADSIGAIVAGAAAIVVSVGGNTADNKPENATTNLAAQAMVKALDAMGESAPRVIQIGGATAMLDTREDMLKQMPFPAPEGSPMYARVFGHAEALKTYRASNIKWTILNPAENILGMRGNADKRTGTYRTSTTELVRNAKGESTITVSDLAAAAVDEVENSRFIRQRFTVGY